MTPLLSMNMVILEKTIMVILKQITAAMLSQGHLMCGRPALPYGVR